MLLITCPHCGPRNETEFACGGESNVVRPGLDCADEAWADYIFYRDNPRGVTRERWRHQHGCGQWFNVARDTVSHKIIAIDVMTDSIPAPAPAKKRGARNSIDGTPR